MKFHGLIYPRLLSSRKTWRRIHIGDDMKNCPPIARQIEAFARLKQKDERALARCRAVSAALLGIDCDVAANLKGPDKAALLKRIDRLGCALMNE